MESGALSRPKVVFSSKEGTEQEFGLRVANLSRKANSPVAHKVNHKNHGEGEPSKPWGSNQR